MKLKHHKINYKFIEVILISKQIETALEYKVKTDIHKRVYVKYVICP